MYRALAEPADAIKQFEAAPEKMPFEASSSKAHTEHWLRTLEKVGQVDAGVTADHPLYAVFRKGKTRTYCVYNAANQPRTVVFSDGFEQKAEARSWATSQREIK
jgi:hypothetical protein